VGVLSLVGISAIHCRRFGISRGVNGRNTTIVTEVSATFLRIFQTLDVMVNRASEACKSIKYLELKPPLRQYAFSAKYLHSYFDNP
jgi:hypothetical protein